VLFLFSVYSFEVFIPSNIPFLIFFSLLVFFLFHFVFPSPLCCNSWPSSQYSFLFLLFLIHFCYSIPILHHSTYLPLDFCLLPLYSLLLFHLQPLLIHLLCSHSNFSFLRFVHLCYSSNGAPKGGPGCRPPPQTPKTKIKIIKSLERL
jgi:hypothetical protein